MRLAVVPPVRSSTVAAPLRRALLCAIVALTPVIVTAPATAQSGWRRRTPPRFRDPTAARNPSFTFARVLYDSVRREWLGQGWFTDYPDGDVNFMFRFEELTRAVISRDEAGDPDYVVVRLTDDNLFDYPFIFMSDVGTVGFRDEEVPRLRTYLLGGGFLYADDFWGETAFGYWAEQIGRVLPEGEYPIVDIPPDHPIFHMLYEVPHMPQIPSIQFWRTSGRSSTSERGADSAVPHLRGIFDERGRLMVVMSHNTDIADGWEREGEEYEFFYRFSSDAYALAINIVLYAMTH